jgi:hypothetical protein
MAWVWSSDEVFSFLREQLGFEIPLQGSVLGLTEEQARAVVALAMSAKVTLGVDTEAIEPQ